MKRWTGHKKLDVLVDWLSGNVSAWDIRREHGINAAQLRAWRRVCVEQLHVTTFLARSKRRARLVPQPSATMPWERRGKPPAWIKGKPRPSQRKGRAA